MTIGKIVVNYALDFYSEFNKLMSKYYRCFNDRCFYFYILPSDLRVKFTKGIYDLLKNNHVLSLYGFALSINDKSVRIVNAKPKSIWYRLGLAMSDGSYHSRSNIMFSVSTSHTIDCILNSFSRMTLYLARYIGCPRSGKISPAFNIMVKDEELAQIISRMKREKQLVNIELVSQLIRNKRALAEFLAGVIDGDGCPDRYGIRVSISTSDPLYSILQSIFDKDIHYDHDKYILAIHMKRLRKIGILEYLAEEVISPHKKEKIRYLIKKRKRVEFACFQIDDSHAVNMINSLDSDLRELLSKLKTRTHGKYVYLYVPINNRNYEHVYNDMVKLLSSIGGQLGRAQDFVDSLKHGNRELVIYNQCVVRTLLALKKVLGEGR